MLGNMETKYSPFMSVKNERRKQRRNLWWIRKKGGVVEKAKTKRRW
jgi:hypothetical protein